MGGVGGTSPRGPQPLTLGTGPDAIEYTCPMVDTRSGAGAWQVPAAGGLRYQGSIANLARECAIVASTKTMTMKVGIEGRVLLGDKGTPGAVNVPIRIAVVQEGASPKIITSKFFNVPVNVPADGTVSFTVVEDTISFPLPSPSDLERYVVYAGFDPKGTETRPAATSRPARPRPAAPAAEAPAAAAPAAATPAPAAATPAATAPARSTTTTAPASTSSGTTSSGTSGGFAPPPSSSSSSSSSGAFGPPPSTGTFGPPPTTFGPPPATSSQ